jgi:predicted DNA-binding transcriptional regulator YafY
MLSAAACLRSADGMAGLAHPRRRAHRDDFRHFRVKRILNFDVRDENLPVSSKTLFARWQARFGIEEKAGARARKLRRARQGTGLTVKMPDAKRGGNV